MAKTMQTDVRVLCINDDVKIKIAKLVQYASDHKIDFDTVEKIAGGNQPPIGDDPNYVCFIPDGYRVAFSIEQQPDKYWYKHLSISVNNKSKLPSIPAAEMIMKEFGFVGIIKDLDHVYVEDKVRPAAVNLIQKCDK